MKVYAGTSNNNQNIIKSGHVPKNGENSIYVDIKDLGGCRKVKYVLFVNDSPVDIRYGYAIVTIEGDTTLRLEESLINYTGNDGDNYNLPITFKLSYGYAENDSNDPNGENSFNWVETDNVDLYTTTQLTVGSYVCLSYYTKPSVAHADNNYKDGTYYGYTISSVEGMVEENPAGFEDRIIAGSDPTGANGQVRIIYRVIDKNAKINIGYVTSRSYTHNY